MLWVRLAVFMLSSLSYCSCSFYEKIMILLNKQSQHACIHTITTLHCTALHSETNETWSKTNVARLITFAHIHDFFVVFACCLSFKIRICYNFSDVRLFSSRANVRIECLALELEWEGKRRKTVPPLCDWLICSLRFLDSAVDFLSWVYMDQQQ